MHSDYVSLLLITLLAVVVPVLASKLRIVSLPIVVGEILAGMIIGKSGFNLVEPSTTLSCRVHHSPTGERESRRAMLPSE